MNYHTTYQQLTTINLIQLNLWVLHTTYQQLTTINLVQLNPWVLHTTYQQLTMINNSYSVKSVGFTHHLSTFLKKINILQKQIDNN